VTDRKIYKFALIIKHIMPDIQLEYRIAKSHIGKGLIETPDLVVHTHNQYWSYARHLPTYWDFSNNERRKSVASKLLDNLESLNPDQEMDLSPLRDDQRVSGIVYGNNPLQNMFNLIQLYSQRYPDQEFHSKWGGGRFETEGKGFAVYVDDDQHAQLTLQRLTTLAQEMEIPIEAFHRYGIVGYQDFVTIDKNLRSRVKDIDGFRGCLESIRDYPHFFHELFLTDNYIESQAPSNK
jgi:hypothetical protein